MWGSGWDGRASGWKPATLREEWGLEVWRTLASSSAPTEQGFSPHLLRQVISVLGYLTLLFLVEFLVRGRVQVTLSALFSLSKFLSRRRGLTRWSPTKPFLAFLLMDGIRHYISPTSLLPWWFQVSVMPSIFPLLPRAAMYGGGGYSLHKDTQPRE